MKGIMISIEVENYTEAYYLVFRPSTNCLMNLMELSFNIFFFFF